MKGLIYKDIILYGKQALLFLGAVMLISSIMLVEPPADAAAVITLLICIVYMFIFLIVGMFEQGIYEKDENYKWKFFIASTPKLMKTQILVKYISTLFIASFTLLWCVVLEQIVKVRDSVSIKTIPVCVMMFGIQIIFRAVEIPVVVRFGSRYASMYRMIVSFIVISIVFTYMLFGNLEIFFSKEQFFKFIMKILEGDLKEMFRRWCGYTIAAAGILYFISYRISVRIAEK